MTYTGQGADGEVISSSGDILIWTDTDDLVGPSGAIGPQGIQGLTGPSGVDGSTPEPNDSNFILGSQIFSV